MASSTSEITEGVIFQSTLRDGARGIIHYVRDDGGSGSPTDLSLYASLDGLFFALIETFTAESIREVALCPFMAVYTGSAAALPVATISASGSAIFGDSRVYINETR